MPNLSPSSITHCLNCGHPLQESDRFCPNCGQEKKPPTPRFRQLIVDFLGDFITFDSKIIRSLKPLLISPGRITRDYLEGKQIRYIPPIRFFLFLSVVLVLILSWGSNIRSVNIFPNVRTQVAGEDTVIYLALDSVVGKNIDSVAMEDTSIVPDLGVEIQRMIASGYESKGITDSLMPNAGLFAKMMVAQSIKFQHTQGEGFTGYLIGNLTIFLTVILFLLAIWLALLYIQHKRSFLEHLVHSVHLHAFLMVAFILFHILFLITGWAVHYLIAIPFAWYFWSSIKTVYEQGKWKTLWKAALSFLVYAALIFPVTFVIMLLLTFMLF